ncbi:MAG TPA: integrase arm-type DNA-binding domain-containing protein [Oligoflexia bacterium]|nr:integrase arm-type DNA-binding domain-containing protein [Oligoflexia bacterium]HMP47973.1 integrase arm-type DNA-binding domain-containing protein [Oligoflexia bacterium]
MNDEDLEMLTTEKSQIEIFDSNFPEKGSFGVRATYLGTKSFFYIYLENGKKKRITIGRFPALSVSEARSKAVALARKLRLGKVVRFQNSGNSFNIKNIENNDISFSQLSARYLHHLQISGKSLKTRTEYQRLLNKEILPYLGEIPVRSINRLVLRKILEDISFQRGKRILANRTRSLLFSIFEFAIDRDIRSINPVAKIEKLRENQSDQPLLTIDEFRSLYFLTKSKYSQSSRALTFIIGSGIPLSNVLSLKWSDIVHNLWFTKEEKNNKVMSRPLFLNQIAMDVLKAQSIKRPICIYVFSSRNDKPLKYLEKSINKFGIEANISVKVSYRVLRRSLKNIVADYGALLDPPLTKEEYNDFFNINTSKNHTISNSSALLSQEKLSVNQNSSGVASGEIGPSNKMNKSHPDNSDTRGIRVSRLINRLLILNTDSLELEKSKLSRLNMRRHGDRRRKSQMINNHDLIISVSQNNHKTITKKTENKYTSTGKLIFLADFPRNKR